MQSKNVWLKQRHWWQKVDRLKGTQGQASGMDGTLTLIFAISKTTRDSKKFIKKH